VSFNFDTQPPYTSSSSIIILINGAIMSGYWARSTVLSPHMNPQSIGACVLPFTAIDWAWILDFRSTGTCASLSLEMSSQVPQSVYACQDRAATVRTRDAILSIDVW
jgi:hypothetical protein